MDATGQAFGPLVVRRGGGDLQAHDTEQEEYLLGPRQELISETS